MPRSGTGARTTAPKLIGLALLLAMTVVTGVVMYRIVHGPDCTYFDFATHQRVLCNADHDPRAWVLAAALPGAFAGFWLAGDAAGPVAAVWLASWGIGPLVAALQPHASTGVQVIGWVMAVPTCALGLWVLYVWVQTLREPPLPAGIND